MITKVFLVLGLVALTHQQDPYYYKYATYKPGRQYDNGDRVRVNTEVYQCRPPPYNKFCVKDAFAPTGKQRDKAWFKVEEHKIDQERRDFYLQTPLSLNLLVAVIWNRQRHGLQFSGNLDRARRLLVRRQSDTGWIALRMPVCSERTAVLFECLQTWNEERETGVDERDL